MDVRPYLLMLVKALVYSRSEEEMLRLYSSPRDDAVAKTYPQFIHHVHTLIGKREKWALCFRKSLIIRGANTNNYAESAVRIVKDIVLGRTKAFSAVQVCVVYS